MPINFIQGFRDVRNDPLIQGVGQAAQQVGQAYSGKTLKSMFQDVIDAGGSPITAMQKIMPFDPELAAKLGDAESKKRGNQFLKDYISKELGIQAPDDVDASTLAGAAQISLSHYNAETQRANANINLYKAMFGGGEGQTAPSAVRTFEMQYYGKEVPELRGSPQYRSDLLKWNREKAAANPYIQGMQANLDRQTRAEAGRLRGEFTKLPEVKEAVDVNRKFGVMEKAIEKARQMSASLPPGVTRENAPEAVKKQFIAVDQALITLFNKMTDPNSVVRESEYARTPANQSLIDAMRGWIGKLSGGGAGLTMEGREALYDMAKQFFNVYGNIYNDRLREYRGYYTNIGVPYENYLNRGPFNISGGELGGLTPEQADAIKAIKGE